MTNYPASNGKTHPPELNAEATRLATLADMQASGQPWQGDAAAHSTAELLAIPHPDLATGNLTNSEVLRATELDGAQAAPSEVVPAQKTKVAPVVPVKPKTATKPAQKKTAKK